MVNQAQLVLVVETGPNPGESYTLEEGIIFTIGRELDNSLVIADTRVSRHHTRLWLAPDGTAMVEDLGSTNGTFVNRQPVRSPRPLAPGDVIELADAARLRFDVLAAAPSQAATVKISPEVAAPPVGVEPAPFGVAPPAEPAPAWTPAPVPAAAWVPEPVPTPAAWTPGPATPATKPQRSLGFYAGIGCLVLLVFFCIAVALYLWFAPASFWEWFFATVGIARP